jgi:nicotinamidase-related amidase
MANTRSIYLVLDMQNDLAHADGPSGKGPMGQLIVERGVVQKTAAAIKAARAAGLLIGFVRVGFSEGYPQCPPRSPIFSGAPKAGLFKLGTWGTEIHPDLGAQPTDVDIIKHRVSPFYATDLETTLRAQNIGRIYCSGVSTQAVVQATVRDGHDRDYDMIVLEDACAAHSKEEHENSINSLKRFCTVETSATVKFANPEW